MPPYVLTVRAAFRGAASRLLALGRQVLETDVVDAAGTFIQSWAQTLAVGNATGGTNPQISAGDSIDWVGATQDYQAGLKLRIGGVVFYNQSNTQFFLRAPIIRFSNAVPSPLIDQEGTDGHGMTVAAQDGGGLTAGGGLTLRGGENASGTGGAVRVRGGTGSGTAGKAHIQHADGADAIIVEEDGSGHGGHPGGQAIRVDADGLAFFAGATAESPAVVGGKGGNPALASLCSVLASMGLITDNTT